MAKFCNQCGKKLVEGQICACQMEKKIDTLTEIKKTIRTKSNLLLEIEKAIIKAPIDTIKKYGTNKNFCFSIFVIVMNVILFGLYFYCFFKEGTSIFHFLIMTKEVPFLKTMLLGIMLMIVGFLVTIAMIYMLLSVVCKAKVNFKSITSMVGICSIVLIIPFLFSLLILFLSLKLSFFILMVTSLFYLVYLSQGIIEVGKIDKNKLAYVFVPTISVTLFVVIYLVPSIF